VGWVAKHIGPCSGVQNGLGKAILARTGSGSVNPLYTLSDPRLGRHREAVTLGSKRICGRGDFMHYVHYIPRLLAQWAQEERAASGEPFILTTERWAGGGGEESSR
jgi:hypothetical protein